RDQHAIGGRKVDLVVMERDAAVGRMQMDYIFGECALITPKDIARFGLNGEHLIAGGGDEHHALVYDPRRLVTLDLAGRYAPDRLQPRDIIRRDLLERAKTPAVISSAEVEPVSVFRVLQPLGRDWGVILQHLRHRPRDRRR